MNETKKPDTNAPALRSVHPGAHLPGYAIRALLREHAARCKIIAAVLESPAFEAQSFDCSRAIGQLRDLARETEMLEADVLQLEKTTTSACTP